MIEIPPPRYFVYFVIGVLVYWIVIKESAIKIMEIQKNNASRVNICPACGYEAKVKVEKPKK